jgi:lipopolysaccharide/colanic/teichoic acid biosynthesis glycosyltransferase
VSQRRFEVAVAVSSLALLMPLLLLIAAFIKLDDGGSVLFVQTRLGLRKRPFALYKFRTMRDGRVTGAGRWLRATGLDELPQLANVAAGDMSLIGPRPLTAADVARLGWDGPTHALRWQVLPGLLGLAQLYAGRGARLSWFLDRAYVRGRTLAVDLDIVMLSVPMVVLGKRRVRAWLRRYRHDRRLRRLRSDPDRSRERSPTQPMHTARRSI